MIATKKTAVKNITNNAQALVYTNTSSKLVIEIDDDDNNFELFEMLLNRLNIELKEELVYE